MKVTTEGNPTSFSWEVWSQIKRILAQLSWGREVKDLGYLTATLSVVVWEVLLHSRLAVNCYSISSGWFFHHPPKKEKKIRERNAAAGSWNLARLKCSGKGRRENCRASSLPAILSRYPEPRAWGKSLRAVDSSGSLIPRSRSEGKGSEAETGCIVSAEVHLQAGHHLVDTDYLVS